MSNRSPESVEIAVGLALLFSSWLIVFLIAIGIIEIGSPEIRILASIVCYAVSVMGLALSSHGIFVRTSFKKMRKKT